MISNTIILIITGLVAGFLGGLLGIGGAIIIIPILVMFLGYSQQLAQGTTLLMMVIPVGSLAAWQYYKSGNINIKASLILATLFFIGSYLGARYANQIPQEILKKGFAILLLCIALKMLFLDKAIR